jgi:transcription initiation factor IIE alpha subunit
MSTNAIGEENGRLILKTLIEGGNLTSNEISRLTGLAYNTVRQRIKYMIAHGQVVLTDEKRRTRKTNQLVEVYAAVAEDEDDLEVLRERAKKVREALARPIPRDPFTAAFFGEYKQEVAQTWHP